MMNNIGILGCGWLGFPLAKKLIVEGYNVKGTSKSSEKIEKLIEIGVKAYKYIIDQKGIKSSPFFKSLDTLIITIPFVKKHEKIRDLNNVISGLVKLIENESIKNVIYLSSISVYGSQSGEVDESKTCIPESNSGIQLLNIENEINQGSFITTIIRLGGLIGTDRHPINYISGEKFNKGSELVNLIHKIDALGILLSVIKKLSSKNIIYNAVSPFHPSKKEYYTQIAIEKKIDLPIFLNEKKNKKIISSSRVINDLGYSFKIKNLLLK